MCALPNCIGGIFIEGWWYTPAQPSGESWVLDFLGKGLVAYLTTRVALRTIDDRQNEIDLQRAASKWTCSQRPWASDPGGRRSAATAAWPCRCASTLSARRAGSSTSSTPRKGTPGLSWPED